MFCQVAIFDNWRILWWWPSRRNLQWSRLWEFILLMVNDLHHFFFAIAKRDESLVRFMCSFLLKSALESSQIPVCQGIFLTSNWTKPLTGACDGTKVRGRVVKWPRKYWFPWSRMGRVFFIFFFGWEGQIRSQIFFKRLMRRGHFLDSQASP